MNVFGSKISFANSLDLAYFLNAVLALTGKLLSGAFYFAQAFSFDYLEAFFT